MSQDKKTIEDYEGFGKAVKKVKVKTEEMEVVHPKPFDPIADFIMDENGYFLIKIDPEKKTIEVGFCPQVNKVTLKIVGKTPQEIYLEIAKRKLIDRPDHYAYLGKELQKAFIALKKGIQYEQDEELKL